MSHTTGTSHIFPKRKEADTREKFLSSNFLKEKRKKKPESCDFDQDVARRALACMMIMQEYPLYTVEQIGFRRFVQAFQPLFTTVCRKTIKSDILEIYDVERAKTMETIEKNQGRVALSTGMLTAGNRKSSCMAITAHFIDDSWKLQSRILRLVYMPCPHTARGLSDALMDTILDWNIDRKLSTITVDTCSTNDSMIPLLLEKIDPNTMSWSGSLLHVRCAVHILNLIVEEGLVVVKEVIEKIRDTAMFWTATPKRKGIFEETICQLQITFSKKLSLDCAARWNSTFCMLKTALEYKDAFSHLKHRDPQCKTAPTENDWKLAAEVCGILKVFYDFMQFFSGTKYPTANGFLVMICKIKFALSRWISSENVVVRNMASKMVEKYDKYWKNIHGILGVATVLDPQFKMSWIEYCFPRIFAIDSNLKIEAIRKLCYDLLTEYQGKLSKAGGESLSKVVSSFDDGDLSDFYKWLANRKRTKTSHVKSELDRYLEVEEVPMSPDFDVLAWWNSHGSRYPTLQAIAKDILAIPVSTASSEAAFSTSGRIVNPKCNRLHPKTLEVLTCAQSWLSALDREGEPTRPTQFFGAINYDVDENCVSSARIVDD